ncbi:MAG: peptide/nickel transport system substrate-binding protein [Chloroflexota bacterium]|jgi:peptide/nickel transport system substrate-binding protein|nr:peptide/nickel transport system substrate-binding protein [Chloroflexota bacterium]
MMPRGSHLALIALTILVVACSTSPTRPPASNEPGTPALTAPDRELVIIFRGEPRTLAAKEIAPVSGFTLVSARRLFNAGLALVDAQEVPRPYLAESLPELNTASWELLPDGGMETRYRLRAGLTWHDGAPLTADDFVFGFKVYSAPSSNQAGLPPINQIEAVQAPDERTVVIRWRALYAGAAGIDANGFQPLPRHILEPLYTDDADVFARQPFWTTDYLGAGPYRLQSWQPGAFLEATAFADHALGKPRVSRVKALFVEDPNAALTTMLAGDAHAAIGDAVGYQRGLILRQRWAASGGGTVLTLPSIWRQIDLQQRPDYVRPRALLDLRVRRALAYALDRQELNETIFQDGVILTDTMFSRDIGSFAALDAAATKYAYDPVRAEQLMGEAGFRRGPGGTFADATGSVGFELRSNGDAESITEMEGIAGLWRRAGFEVEELPVPPAQARTGEARGAFPTAYVGGRFVGESELSSFTTSQISTPENRWVGRNRSGWSTDAYDRLFDEFSRTLDRTQRTQQIATMVRMLTDQLPTISLYFSPSTSAFVADLVGPAVAAPGSDVTWNVHEWSWR